MTMDDLVDGARGFPARVAARRHEFERLAPAQHPTALFISCSDSRVIPALITDAGPGQLFELRTAGAIIPPYSAQAPCGVSATVEFALVELGIRSIVVCGHSHCGAVGALVSGTAGYPWPAVARWLDQPHLALPRRDDVDLSLHSAIKAHVLNQMAMLNTYPHVRALSQSGDLTVHGWYYEISTGAVLRFDKSQGAFAHL